ncbi:hypothetical protein AQUCO_12000011v1 [Aquilegia coerulea]|uniref:Uncharacterized protein n=1 Tax=Aquilegia coerulea TaxID=218851 RepID=A0A2G5C1Z1_AQUCA|nr:hypothetical protein AQUCO_12000011v1 [Aquilegia coerulea]
MITSSMLKKWLNQHLVCKDEALTKLLSEEEQKLIHFDHWYQPKTQNSIIKALAKKFHTYTVPFVREAYHSIRRTGSEDMAEVLKDEVTMCALFHFAACLKHMKEYSLCMKAIRTDLSRKLKIDETTAFVSSEEAGPSAKPEELDRSI